MQLTLSLSGLAALTTALLGAEASGHPLTPLATALCVALWLIGSVTVQVVVVRRQRRHRRHPRILARIGLRRRPARSECDRIDTKIKDPRDVQRDAAATIRDAKQNSEDRDRAVHDLAHGPGSDDASRRTLRSTIQDHHLDQGHRLAMAAEYRRCHPAPASEALFHFAHDSANRPFLRLEAARLITPENQRRLTTLVIATAADVDAECRLKAAIELKPMAPHDAEEALEVLAKDAQVSFGTRLQAARHWAPINQTAAVEVLWQIVGSTDTPWIWRIAAAAELVVLRVRAAYKILLEWVENRELPEEVRAHVLATLRRLEAQRAV